MKSRPTYLLIEDLPDVPNEPRDVEGEQEANMIAGIGLTLWAMLTEMEDENAQDTPDNVYRKQRLLAQVL